MAWAAGGKGAAAPSSKFGAWVNRIDLEVSISNMMLGEANVTLVLLMGMLEMSVLPAATARDGRASHRANVSPAPMRTRSAWRALAVKPGRAL